MASGLIYPDASLISISPKQTIKGCQDLNGFILNPQDCKSVVKKRYPLTMAANLSSSKAGLFAPPDYASRSRFHFACMDCAESDASDSQEDDSQRAYNGFFVPQFMATWLVPANIQPLNLYWILEKGARRNALRVPAQNFREQSRGPFR